MLVIPDENHFRHFIIFEKNLLTEFVVNNSPLLPYLPKSLQITEHNLFFVVISKYY